MRANVQFECLQEGTSVSYIQFLGAAGGVTGSKHLISTSSNGDKDGFRVLVDCGLFQ